MSRALKIIGGVFVLLYCLFRIMACVTFDLPSVIRCPMFTDTDCPAMTTQVPSESDKKSWYVQESIYPYCKWVCERRTKRFGTTALRSFVGEDYILKQSYPSAFARSYMGFWVLFTISVVISLIGYLANKRWAPLLMIYSSIPMLVCLVEPLFYLSTPLARFFLMTDGLGVAGLLYIGIRLRQAAQRGCPPA